MNIDNAKLSIVMSDFNISITNSMKDAAVKYFLSAGGQNNNISIINA